MAVLDFRKPGIERRAPGVGFSPGEFAIEKRGIGLVGQVMKPGRG
jgi:hypothetical protein